MEDWQRLFALGAVSRGLISTAEFVQRFGATLHSDPDSLAVSLIHSGRMTLEQAREFSDLLQQRLNHEQAKTLKALVRRNARNFLPKVRDPAAGAIVRRWAGLDEQTHEVSLTNANDRSAYRLIKVLAEGGMGELWVAADDSLHRQIILKRLKPAMAEHKELASRLLREAAVTAQLEHPNIVPLHELGIECENGLPYFVMRYLKGRTLREEIERFHERPAAEVSDHRELAKLLIMLRTACNAVAYAHSRGIIHRDLKAMNIHVGDFGEVIVLDWGLAKLIGARTADVPDIIPDLDNSGDLEQTTASHRIGTPLYMAPEQASGDHDAVGKATDIYGLGAVLFEILANEPPHRVRRAVTKEELYRAIMLRDSPRVEEANPKVDPVLSAICAKAMAKAPGDRYPAVLDFAGDIDHWLAGEPTSVYVEPWAKRAGRWIARRPLRAASAFYAVVVVIGVIVAFAGSRISQFEEIEMVEQENIAARSRELEAHVRGAAEILRRQLMRAAESKAIGAILTANNQGAVLSNPAQFPPAVNDIAQLLRLRPEFLRCELLLKESTWVRRFQAARVQDGADDVTIDFRKAPVEPYIAALLNAQSKTPLGVPTIAVHYLRSDAMEHDILLRGTLPTRTDNGQEAFWRIELSLRTIFDEVLRHAIFYRRYYLTDEAGKAVRAYVDGAQLPVSSENPQLMADAKIIENQLFPKSAGDGVLEHVQFPDRTDVGYCRQIHIDAAPDSPFFGYASISDFRVVFNRIDFLRDMVIVVVAVVTVLMAVFAILLARGIMHLLRPRR